MAVTIVFLLLAALMARVASAGVYAGTYAGSSAGGFGFNNPTFINPIKLPQLPGFNLPKPPALPWPSNFPFPNIAQPQVPNFPQAPDSPQQLFPNFQQIMDQIGGPQSQRPGSNSIVLTSHHSVIRGEDGQLQKTGGSTLVSNKNGEVTVHKIGDAPPSTSRIPAFADFQQPEFKQQNFRNFKRSNFDFPTMEPFSFDLPLKIESIEGYTPKGNENFKGVSYKFSSYSNEENGVKDHGGEASLITNNNGIVKKENFIL